MKTKRSSLVPAILAATAAAIKVDTETLPKGSWRTHSGKAPVAGEEVHSLQSQKIAGTKNIVLKAESGRQLSVTMGEAEVFSADFLKGLGYSVTAPTAAA